MSAFDHRQQHFAAQRAAARSGLVSRLRRLLRALRRWWAYRPERRYMRG